MLEEHRISISQSLCEGAARLTADAQTVIWFADHEKALAIAGITDRIKPTSIQAVSELQSAGIEVYMLTGDNEATAQEIAHKAGILHYKAGVLPQEKAAFIGNLQKNGKKVAMVGDGINDAPVLSRVDVGIAMGALGSDAAIEAADVVLMDDDPAKIALAMRIARRTKSIVYQNIVFALAIKAACLLLGALGIANMWAAIFADVGVMVLAVLNATRALYTKDLTKK